MYKLKIAKFAYYCCTNAPANDTAVGLIISMTLHVKFEYPINDQVSFLYTGWFCCTLVDAKEEKEEESQYSYYGALI